MSTDTVTADRTRDRGGADLGVEDVMPVRSRIAWGAILAGAVLALALYFLLTLLGGAIGLSVGGDADPATLGTGAAIWAILTTALCLFAGGYLASQSTVGENRTEGGVYGALVWAVVFAMLLWLMASGVRAGFNAMVGVATAGGAAVGAAADAVPTGAASNLNVADLERWAKGAGIEQSQIDRLKASAESEARQAKDAVTSGEAERDARRTAGEAAGDAADAATTVTWLTFAGTLLSMLAAVGGGVLGAGPSFRLVALPAGRGAVR